MLNRPVKPSNLELYLLIITLIIFHNSLISDSTLFDLHLTINIIAIAPIISNNPPLIIKYQPQLFIAKPFFKSLKF